MTDTVTIVGIKVATFESKEGRDILYAKLSVLHDEDSGNKEVRGQMAEVLKADPDLCDHLELGMRGVPMYNRFGKCIGFNAE